LATVFFTGAFFAAVFFAAGFFATGFFLLAMMNSLSTGTPVLPREATR
jgi:hypothetical protein